MDALRSVLPAGTLSGAPKVRAMQIIDELEPVKRGGYGGAVGYLSTAAISTPRSTSAPSSSRTASPTCRPAAARSRTREPDYEYEESVAKMSAAMRAIALACEQPDWP